MKYILISGGSISGIGKGRLACSIGKILQSYGHKITFLKIDPYLNYNAGKMTPDEHGETFVCEDGTQADLDLGSYERSCSLILNSANSITTGKILFDMIEEEKNGLHNGKTLQFCSGFHERAMKAFEKLSTTCVKQIIDGKTVEYLPEIAIIELGGTVGDLEAQFFIKSLERFLAPIPQYDKCLITIEYLIDFHGTKKTRIIQNSLNQLKSYGMENNILVYRSDIEMSNEHKSKISTNCGIDIDNIIWAKSCSSVYEIPKMFFENGLFKSVCKELNLKTSIPQQFSLINNYLPLIKKYNKSTKIGIISRYNPGEDPYYSLEEMLFVSGKLQQSEIEIVYINSLKLEENDEKTVDLLKSVSGILCPGGFGNLGYKGKINGIKFARENNIPFLGICLCYQLAIIEFCRNCCQLKEACSTEFEPNTPTPVISKFNNIVCDNTNENIYLGSYPVKFTKEFEDIYKSETGNFRFRHSFGFNQEFKDIFEKNGMIFTGISTNDRIAAFKLKDHIFFAGVQYHPELSSKPESIDPILHSFVKASIENKF